VHLLYYFNYPQVGRRIDVDIGVTGNQRVGDLRGNAVKDSFSRRPTNRFSS
jgi:hypothetical protein